MRRWRAYCSAGHIGPEETSGGRNLQLVLPVLPLTAANVSAWADVTQAITTLGALIAAGFAWQEAHKLNDREGERDRRQEEDRLREGQAAHINAWPVWMDPTWERQVTTVGVRVSNTSRVPLYGGVLYMGWDRQGDYVGVAVPIELIPPGEFADVPMPDFMYQFAVNSGAFKTDELSYDDEPPSRVPPIKVALEFDDWLDAQWARDTYGSLILLSRSGRGTGAFNPLMSWRLIPAPPPPINQLPHL